MIRLQSRTSRGHNAFVPLDQCRSLQHGLESQPVISTPATVPCSMKLMPSLNKRVRPNYGRNGALHIIKYCSPNFRSINKFAQTWTRGKFAPGSLHPTQT
ncbi:hypothetical protein AcW1_007446 [Taiwanofungus camphoratus]|nr:hypothetical protein AcW1_007446 [Antrodia cinnamomea]